MSRNHNNSKCSFNNYSFGLNNSDYQSASIIGIVGSLLTILSAIISLYPIKITSEDEEESLIYFSHISRYTREEYLKLMMERLETRETIAKILVLDIYYLNARILAPKFRWLRITYSLFFLTILSAALSLIL